MPRPRRFYLPPPDSERRYLNLLLDPLNACSRYKPKFGTNDSAGVTLEQFKILYGEDPFYHWVGLDSDLMSSDNYFSLSATIRIPDCPRTERGVNDNYFSRSGLQSGLPNGAVSGYALLAG